MDEAESASSHPLAAALTAGDRTALARAITLVESRRADHAREAARLVQEILPLTGRAVRVGLTGPPGVGKSTLIDSLGSMLTGRGRRVAVLAVDPSSTRTGGSILGDKTRMARLSVDPRAFIRPSPSAGALGGVAARTREAMLLCEAAGYDVVIVETMGVGQAETAVADMVDTFVALMLPGAGDELQGIKKGLVEIADVIAVNKADADPRAAGAAAEYRAAMRILARGDDAAQVLAVSGMSGAGLEELWGTVERLSEHGKRSGKLEERRRAQQVTWMWTLIYERLREMMARNDEAQALEREVEAGRLAPSAAAEVWLNAATRRDAV